MFGIIEVEAVTSFLFLVKLEVREEVALQTFFFMLKEDISLDIVFVNP